MQAAYTFYRIRHAHWPTVSESTRVSHRKARSFRLSTDAIEILAIIMLTILLFTAAALWSLKLIELINLLLGPILLVPANQ
jgi:hypothetical protein